MIPVNANPSFYEIYSNMYRQDMERRAESERLARSVKVEKKLKHPKDIFILDTLDMWKKIEGFGKIS